MSSKVETIATIEKTILDENKKKGGKKKNN